MTAEKLRLVHQAQKQIQRIVPSQPLLEIKHPQFTGSRPSAILV
jgi:hypothetical protein